MKLGFTGTARERFITVERRKSLQLRLRVFKDQGYTEFHHGDCIGADETAHYYADAMGFAIVIHPPLDSKARAFCQVNNAGVILEPDEYLIRNQAIVDACDLLIAMPRVIGKEHRSGTWSTVWRARKKGISVEFV